jgi:hypothetical protein
MAEKRLGKLLTIEVAFKLILLGSSSLIASIAFVTLVTGVFLRLPTISKTSITNIPL